VAGVAFTGSTSVGSAIAQALAARAPIVPLIAETGGQNAMIVDSSALPEQVVQDVLELTDLKYKADAFVDSLSRGMTQRLSLARVLVHDPPVLLLDEPSQGLAPLVVESVMETIRDLKKERVSMLLVEQNAEMALQLADRVYVIDHGTVVFEGTPAALRADRQVTTTYLGVGG